MEMRGTRLRTGQLQRGVMAREETSLEHREVDSGTSVWAMVKTQRDKISS